MWKCWAWWSTAKGWWVRTGIAKKASSRWDLGRPCTLVGLLETGGICVCGGGRRAGLQSTGRKRLRRKSQRGLEQSLWLPSLQEFPVYVNEAPKPLSLGFDCPNLYHLLESPPRWLTSSTLTLTSATWLSQHLFYLESPVIFSRPPPLSFLCLLY